LGKELERKEEEEESWLLTEKLDEFSDRKSVATFQTEMQSISDFTGRHFHHGCLLWVVSLFVD
jgi:hypothetical protein